MIWMIVLAGIAVAAMTYPLKMIVEEIQIAFDLGNCRRAWGMIAALIAITCVPFLIACLRLRA